jgi:predicted AlkP superfamily phosphohydrolase/phosphomutase
LVVDTKAILIGLDGLGWDVLEPGLETGRLPTLAALREEGMGADLESTHPPWTPCAWPSLLSGRNPGAHGLFDFFTRDGYEKRLADRRDVDAPYLPDVAATEGRSVVSINFPVTHPIPVYEDGAVVPGYLAPEDARFYPEGIREEYEREHGEYTIYPEYDAEENAVDDYVDVARGRRDMARFLDERFDWDLLAVQFQVTDSVFHDLDDPGERLEVLSAVDGFVSDIVDLGEDPTVLVASDHGMGDYHWTFYVNTWLAEHGYSETTEGETEYFRTKKSELKGEDDADGSAVATLLGRGMSAASKVGLTPNRVHTALSAVGLAGIVERLLPESALVSAQSRTVDWERSDAFQIFFNSLGVHLNWAGREPAGTLSNSEYEALREELIAELERVRDPDGNVVFDEVKRKEAVYDGPHLDDAPDLLLYPRDYDYDVSGSILGPFRRYEHQNHRPDGILVAAGPGVTDATVDRASILDVAPTLAALLDVPLDDDRDGSVLPFCEPPSEEAPWRSLAHIDYGSSEVTDSDVEERLADLGYME